MNGQACLYRHTAIRRATGSYAANFPCRFLCFRNRLHQLININTVNHCGLFQALRLCGRAAEAVHSCVH